MGCCLSSNNPQTKPSKPDLSHQPNPSPNSRAPPPTHPLPEEETVVKEVLSETPISRIPQNEPLKEPLKHSAPKANLHQSDVVVEEPKKALPSEEVGEEVSEICSTLSESCVSTATGEMNSVAEPEDDNEVTQIKNRRVVKDRLMGRQQKGQSRRSEALPGRVRSEASPGRVRSGLRDGNSNGMRRLGPERRSRSPATRVDGPGSRSGLGRCPSGRRTGKSPGRVAPPELVEKSLKVEPKVDTVAKLDSTNDESLENPHVSLECFIFL